MSELPDVFFRFLCTSCRCAEHFCVLSYISSPSAKMGPVFLYADLFSTPGTSTRRHPCSKILCVAYPETPPRHCSPTCTPRSASPQNTQYRFGVWLYPSTGVWNRNHQKSGFRTTISRDSVSRGIMGVGFESGRTWKAHVKNLRCD